MIGGFGAAGGVVTLPALPGLFFWYGIPDMRSRAPHPAAAAVAEGDSRSPFDVVLVLSNELVQDDVKVEMGLEAALDAGKEVLLLLVQEHMAGLRLTCVALCWSRSSALSRRWMKL